MLSEAATGAGVEALIPGPMAERVPNIVIMTAPVPTNPTMTLASHPMQGIVLTVPTMSIRMKVPKPADRTGAQL